MTTYNKEKTEWGNGDWEKRGGEARIRIYGNLFDVIEVNGEKDLNDSGNGIEARKKVKIRTEEAVPR